MQTFVNGSRYFSVTYPLSLRHTLSFLLQLQAAPLSAHVFDIPQLHPGEDNQQLKLIEQYVFFPIEF